MTTWLFVSLDDSERSYKGHLGYADDLRCVYKYDSFVRNHKRVRAGDLAIIRGKKRVFGSAIIQSIEVADGTKIRNRCPFCGESQLKERKERQPRFRCGCGAEFDEPVVDSVPCQQYSAHFGPSFTDFPEDVQIGDLWAVAPRLNKQLAILELDQNKVEQLVLQAASVSDHPDELPAAASHTFLEGTRTTVLVNRYERDPGARRACLEHYGCKCWICNFDFQSVFGEIGRGFIEIHHALSLSSDACNCLNFLSESRSFRMLRYRCRCALKTPCSASARDSRSRSSVARTSKCCRRSSMIFRSNKLRLVHQRFSLYLRAS